MRCICSVAMVLAFIVIDAIVIDAYAESPEIDRIKAREEESLANDARALNESCGSTINVRLDWSAVPADDLKTYGAEQHCDRALRGIGQVCSDAAGKDAVKKQIRSVVCGFAAKRSVALKDGVLDYKIDFKPLNDGIMVFEYLQGNL